MSERDKGISGFWYVATGVALGFLFAIALTLHDIFIQRQTINESLTRLAP